MQVDATALPGASIAENAAVPQRGRRWLFALISAVLMTAAYPPLDLGFLAWIGLAPLFYAVLDAPRPRSAFGLGYMFGYVHWGLTVTWIGTTVVAWSGTPLGWIAWILLVAIKSLWFGLFGFLAWWIGRRSKGLMCILALAAAWTIIEWLRGQSAVAMPWSLTGYSQYRYLPLIQIAEISGVYIVGFAVALFNAGICLGSRQRRGLSGAARSMAAPAVLFMGVAGYGVVRLGQEYPGDRVSIALMQPNLGSGRFTTEPEGRALQRYRKMALTAAAKKPVMMIWPESTAERAAEDAESREAFSAIARDTGAYQIVGTGFVGESGASHNSAALFAPRSGLQSRYDKHWLVPFGEWIPLRGYLPFGDVFGFPPRDVVPGTSDSLMIAGPSKMSVLICYESVFPVLSRVRTAAGANLLVSITNDSWAGESAELMQHHAMTAFRAVETRRFVASSATTGITALIEPSGSADRVQPYREAILVKEARLLEGLTPYVQFGDWFVLLCGIAVVLSVSGRPRKNT